MAQETSSPRASGRPTRFPRRRLGEVLVELGLLDREQLQAALAAQADVGPGEGRLRLGQVVVERGLVDENRLASALAQALALRLADPGPLQLDPATARLLPRALSERRAIVALDRTPTGGLRVAAVDPTDVVALDDVRLHAGTPEVSVVVATESQVREATARAWSLAENASDFVTLFDDLGVEVADGGVDEFGEAPVVRLVNDMYADAVRLGASDIHIEPQAGDLRVRYRVDGLLRDVMTVPKRVSPAMVSRIKVTSGLDIAERRRPQDGRTRLTFDGRGVDARVSTLPTVHGEKVVIRLLPTGDEVPPLAALGLTERQLETLLTGLVRPQGLVLITGPTGSGKTSTLYSAIAAVRTPDRNVVTLEDPVEVEMPGVNQVQVNDRIGMTFATGLRSILRQDPDIVLVGEIRDTETAELALRASLTGHLVLATLHTNDAASALTRLVDMGVPSFLVASSLAMVVGQRLVRGPCAGCVAGYVPSTRTLDLLGLRPADLAGATPRRGRGCAQCAGTGYRGRVGVFEVLTVTASVRRALLTTPTEETVRSAARAAGMVTMRATGLARAHAGETTYEEVVRVTTAGSTDTSLCRSCERPVGDDMVVCPWCAVAVDRGHCPGCSRPLDPLWRVCPWCRLPVPPDPADAGPGGHDDQPRVLVVDDDASVRSLLAVSLTEEFAVDAVGSGDDALAAVASGGYAAMVIDQVLPDLTGVEVIRLLRADPVTAALPVLMLTGSADTRAVERAARAAGADDYLTKPFEPDLLADRVGALCRRGAGAGRVAPRT